MLQQLLDDAREEARSLRSEKEMAETQIDVAMASHRNCREELKSIQLIHSSRTFSLNGENRGGSASDGEFSIYIFFFYS